MIDLEEKAAEAAELLASMANKRRLLVLCNLVAGERSAGELAGVVGLSPAALSQHLAKLRMLGLVTTRRDGQSIFYSLASAEVRAVLETLYRLYCAPPRKPARSRAGKSTARGARARVRPWANAMD